MADWLTEELGSLCTKTFIVQCARVKDFCCVVDAIPQRLSFVVVLPYKNFCWLQSANVRYMDYPVGWSIPLMTIT